MMTFVISLLVLFAALFAPAGSAQAGQLRVVTTLPDLKYLVEQVGGDRVRVETLARGTQDFHFLEAKPSYIVKLAKADLLVLNGLELEIGWLPPLMNQARNAKILKGGPGYVEAYRGVPLLEVPEGKVDRSMGDIHPFGNPHYLLDPANLKIVATHIYEGLARVAPEEKSFFQEKFKKLTGRLDQALKKWERQFAGLRGMAVIAYHNSWPYFAKRFGLKVVAFVEPKPGISPSPAWIQTLIQKIKRDRIQLLMMEAYHSQRVPELLARETGIRIAVLAHNSGANPEVKTPFDLFEYNLRLLEGRLSGGR